MEIFPSEYQNLSLSRYEKMFVRHAISSDSFGFLLLKVNPSMQTNDEMHVVMLPDGVVFCKFFNEITDIAQFTAAMGIYATMIYPSTKKILTSRLLTNKAICDSKGTLKFATTILYVFPSIKREDVKKSTVDSGLKKFINESCIFEEDFSKMRTGFVSVFSNALSTPITPVSSERLVIGNDNINSILQRIAPEYVTVRVASVKNTATSRGADNELLVIDEHDKAVKAFRLEPEQINIVNKISKGDQLILACAGSGKSVLLISKCFKAAAMNPDKQFLITCYNNNLYSLYVWFIDRAGLKSKNVSCKTFDQLCIDLLGNEKDRYHEYEDIRNAAISRLNDGTITQRYYGIFIDEVQIFETEWYKFCYNLLENKDSDDHLFVICGDKTQDLEKKKKHGTAPWQAGEGYPNYRNKCIRIEKNYRNCIEINEFINRYVSNAKQYLYSIEPSLDIDPDMFLRGQAVTKGVGAKYKELSVYNNASEIDAIVESIEEIHDNQDIPYDEIAVIMYNAFYRKQLPQWGNKWYSIEDHLMKKLDEKDIPYTRLYSVDGARREHFGELGGVKMLKFKSTLGLDFRAAIICGLKPFGFYENIKTPDWNEIRNDEEAYNEAVQATHTCVRELYVACTRAKEVLHIISPEKETDSIFIHLLKKSI